MKIIIKKFGVATIVLAVFLWTENAFAQIGQWGGFIYLTPKSAAGIPSDKKEDILRHLEKDPADFVNDFKPEKGKTETLQFYKGVEYSLNGAPVPGKAPTLLVRVESMKRAKVDDYCKAASHALGDYFDAECKFAVTRELNYTDAQTLEQLKANAPARGDGISQPNAVVLPISKTAAWWSMPLDKRKSYFDQKPDLFGKDHLGHNAIGFVYIKDIFRKLYHSRFIDDRQDFITYFEFSDSHVDTYKKLLNGLRSKQSNPEWELVQEKPLFWGRRVASLKEIL